MILTQERLRELLDYDPDTGHFTWRKRRKGVYKSRGLSAGSAPNTQGYIQISLDRKIYLAHRLAWLYTHGQWPDHQIDHINCIRHDNRISNLREATQSQQSANSSKPSHNGTGYKGVTFHRGARKYMAQITHAGQHHYLGLFDTPEEAADARSNKAKELHGDFAKD